MPLMSELKVIYAAMGIDIWEMIEAVKALSRELLTRDPSIPWTQIAGFRDVLAHSYFAVDTSVIWDAASQKAPALKISCEKLL